jgi:hypothetical protein
MSWLSNNVKHALSRLFGGPSHAGVRQRESLLQQEEEARRETETRRDILSRLRRAMRSGRLSLLSWYDDGEDSIGA